MRQDYEILTEELLVWVFQCHETRSLDSNRKIARQKLRELLDVQINRENSFTEQQRREDSICRKAKKTRAKKNLERKLAFKDREGLD